MPHAGLSVRAAYSVQLAFSTELVELRSYTSAPHRPAPHHSENTSAMELPFLTLLFCVSAVIADYYEAIPNFEMTFYLFSDPDSVDATIRHSGIVLSVA